MAAALYTAYPMADLVRSIEAFEAAFFLCRKCEDFGELCRPPKRKGHTAGACHPDDRQRTWRFHHSNRCAKWAAHCLSVNLSAMARIQEEISPQDGAILYLTSGATGEPKMGLTSHAAVIANIDMGPAVLPIGCIDSTIVFLPSAHITQRIALELLPMRMGTPVYFSESLSRLPAELKAIGRHSFLRRRAFGNECTPPF